jgi:hypothetical protein
MTNIIYILQITLALGLFNVWLVRFHRKTPYRGGDSVTMEDEFHSYGLSTNFMYLVGFLKLGTAAGMILGLWFNIFVVSSATLLSILMIGAIFMHLKVRDRLIKFLPALLLLAMSLVILIYS